MFGRHQAKRQLRRDEVDAVLIDRDLVPFSPVVERRFALHAEPDCAFHRAHPSDDLVPPPGRIGDVDRHEIG